MPQSTIDIAIQGMTCDHCVKTVQQALERVQGVQSVEVSLPEKRARVTYDDSTCKPAELQALIEAEGYNAGLYGTDSPSYSS